MTATHGPHRERPSGNGYEIALELVEPKWSLPILFELAERPARRKQLKRRLCGINDDRLDSTLTRQLRWGLVVREWIAGPRSDEPGYALTPLGRSMLRAFDPLVNWQGENATELDERRRIWDQSHPASAR